MRNIYVLLFLSFTMSFTMISCVQEGAIGGTIASQVSGNFTSSTATIMVDNEMVADSTQEYSLRITEVDANTVSILTPDIPTFEVDLEKSENGEWNTGKTGNAASGFTFNYYVPDATLEIIYTNGGASISFKGLKE